jgi:hypothetical protein
VVNEIVALVDQRFECLATLLDVGSVTSNPE